MCMTVTSQDEYIYKSTFMAIDNIVAMKENDLSKQIVKKMLNLCFEELKKVETENTIITNVISTVGMILL